jgi:hypothetical protein
MRKLILEPYKGILYQCRRIHIPERRRASCNSPKMVLTKKWIAVTMESDLSISQFEGKWFEESSAVQ